MTFLCVITEKNFARKFAKKRGGLINFYKGGDDQKGVLNEKGGGGSHLPTAKRVELLLLLLILLCQWILTQRGKQQQPKTRCSGKSER